MYKWEGLDTEDLQLIDDRDLVDLSAYITRSWFTPYFGEADNVKILAQQLSHHEGIQKGITLVLELLSSVDSELAHEMRRRLFEKVENSDVEPS